MDGSQPAPRAGLVVGVLAVAGIVAALMQTLIVPLIGDLPVLLHTTAGNASWAVTITLLVAAVTTPAMGRLADLYGKKQLLLVCTIPLIAGSIVSATAGSLAALIIGRGLQGMGGAMIPIAISALRDLLPPQKLGGAIALISSSLGIGGALGLPIAATVAQHANWHVLFWAAAVLSVLVGLLIWAFIPNVPTTATGGFDIPGALGLGGGLVALLLAISKGADWGWTSGTTLGLFFTAVVVLLAWAWWELRSDSPLVDLRVTARGQVLLTNAASIVVGFAMYAAALIAPQLLQLPKATGYGLGQSMQAAGLWMAPGGLMMMLVSPLGAKLSAARTPKTTLVVGSLVIAAGYGSSMALMGSVWGLLVVSIIVNSGVALAYGAMPALIMGAVPISETSSANSFNTLMRSIGTTLSAAVVGVVLSHMTTHLGPVTIPSHNGFRTGMLIGCGVAVVAAAVAACIPLRKAAAGGPAPTAAPEPAADTVAVDAGETH